MLLYNSFLYIDRAVDNRLPPFQNGKVFSKMERFISNDETVFFLYSNLVIFPNKELPL